MYPIQLAGRGRTLNSEIWTTSCHRETLLKKGGRRRSFYLRLVCSYRTIGNSTNFISLFCDYLLVYNVNIALFKLRDSHYPKVTLTLLQSLHHKINIYSFVCSMHTNTVRQKPGASLLRTTFVVPLCVELCPLVLW